MNIISAGMVFTRGSGIGSFENALHEGWRIPGEVEYSKSNKSFAYQFDQTTIRDKAVLKKMRRADKLSKMAVAAASEALGNSGIDDIRGKNIGIITATALGAQVTTFSFLDDIIEYGESSVSPTTFSNSVHNAAASYISMVLGIRGPVMTVTRFFFSFQSALQLAQSWLNESRCEFILVGAVEQYGDVLAYIQDTKLNASPDGRILPFNLNPAYQVPGEGSVFFLVSNKDTDTALCNIEDVYLDTYEKESEKPDVNIIDTDGLLKDESVYAESLSPDIPTAAYSPVFGSMMSGSAFNCLAGALMLRNRMLYASPVQDNPHGLNIVDRTVSRDIELIRCIRYNCYENKAVICLRKKQ